VLMVRNILEPAADGLDPSEAVADTMNLEEVLPHIARRLVPLPVTDADGRLVGQVTPHAVLTALAGKQRGAG